MTQLERSEVSLSVRSSQYYYYCYCYLKCILGSIDPRVKNNS